LYVYDRNITLSHGVFDKKSNKNIAKRMITSLVFAVNHDLMRLLLRGVFLFRYYLAKPNNPSKKGKYENIEDIRKDE